MGPDETISITSRGKHVFALMSWDFYESLNETMAILNDPVLMKSLKKAVNDIKTGRVTDWDIAKKELAIDL